MRFGVKQQVSPVEHVRLPQVTPVPTHSAPRHATQRCVAVSHSGRPDTPLQSLFFRHCVQVPVLVSQTGSAAGQFALPRHCTQAPDVVSQWAVGGAHVASLVHLSTHACVVGLQICPFEQLASVTHATQVSVAMSQCVRPPGLPVQLASAVHCTHVNELVSQTGRAAVVQLALPRHATQVPLAVSQ